MLFAWVAMSLFANVHAATAPPPQQVTAMEQALFTMTYERDDLNTRLGRLEQSTFGQPTPQLSTDERLSRLSAVILKPQPQKASENTMSPLQEQATPNTPPPQASPSALANTQVTELEKYLLNKTFPKEPLVHRIERLERQVFKRTQTGSIAGRVDHLNQMVMGSPNPQQPQQAASAPVTYPDPDNYNAPPPTQNGPIAYNNPSSYNTSPTQDPYNAPPQYQTQPQSGYPVYPVFNPHPYVNNTPTSAGSPSPLLDQMEKQVFKTSYSAEATPARLDRLESKIFGSTAPDLSESERIDRLSAVVAADGDNPKSAGRVGKGGGWQAILPLVIMLPLLLL